MFLLKPAYKKDREISQSTEANYGQINITGHLKKSLNMLRSLFSYS